MDHEVWDHSVFSKNRERLIEHEVIEAFFTEVMTLADQRNLLSKEHFSVDGTLIQAWGKTVGQIRQTLYRGLERVDQHFKLTMTACNLVRIARIPFAVPQGALQ